MDTPNIAVLGAGSWGTTVAAMISRNADVTLWARNPATVDEVNQHHSNSTYLPDASLPEKMRATADLGEAVAGADVVVMGIPSQYFREVLTKVSAHIQKDVPVVSLTKGLEQGSHLRMSQIVAEVLPEHPAGVLTGPNLAREIIGGKAAASVIAMTHEPSMKDLQAIVGTSLFRVYTNTDVIGCELGGVLKNIIAIAVGMGDGQGAGDNTRAALITRGLAEVTRLGIALGGRAETFAGLAGMGDMIATCISPQSRNHFVGMELARGRDPQDIIADMVMVAEGVKSAPAVMALAEETGVEMPIASEVYRVLSGESSASRGFRGLLRVVAGAESEPG